MKAEHWIALILVLYVADRYNRSHYGMSAVDAATQAELSNFAAMEGTNFTNSVWDPLSGQPAYQFGTISAPGGAAVMGTPSFSGAF
ncbi:hypothetical protein [Trinickia symbiotica]|uniref:Uncharacterized protein n=1 Tax=Trinickia symbiotica TaxID=863227 RepID=A0A2N7XA30_9BURK|nr:hypothetical protein [Trinickia symbiotica]PMS38471.1 hypothetical protein C0Z20_00875 [Trinickia symbiotica]